MRAPGGVWALTIVMWITSFILWDAAGQTELRLVDQASIHWMVILSFTLLAEAFAVHIHLRSPNGRFAFAEIPILLGMLFTPVAVYVPAIVVGGVLALRFARRQRGLAVAFNGANLAFRAALSWTLVHLFIGGSGQSLDLLATEGWLIAGAALMITAMIELSFLVIVVSLSDSSATRRSLATVFLYGVAVAGINVVLGLVTAILLGTEPYSVVLIGFLFVGFGVGYRSFSAGDRQRERMEMLHASSRELAETTERLEAAELVINQASIMFGAAAVELLLPVSELAPDGHGSLVFVHQDDNGTRQLGRRSMTPDEHVLMHELLDLTAEPRLLKSGNEHDELRYLLGREEAMVGRLSFGPETGVLVVGDSLSEARQFGQEDLQVLETLLRQAALAMENGVLGTRIHELKHAEVQLTHDASHDALTGLANRAKFNRTLDLAVDADHDDLALLYVDLDDFKRVNDTLGHAAGDAVLVEVARRLNQSVRTGDVPARFGGDEFAVLIHDNSNPRPLAERILAEVCAPFDYEGEPVSIGATIGLATWEPGLSSRMLVGRADVAMYSAKHAGKGAVASYLDEMAERVEAQQRLRAELKRAVDDDEFTVLYQPVYSLQTRQMVGAEALVRWRSPDGLLLPEGFLLEADRSGLIHTIDKIVMTEVVETLALISGYGRSDLWLSANLSQWSLHDSDLVPTVVQLLDSAGVDPKHLVLEMAEATVMKNPELAVEQLQRLRRSGVNLALDDFGSGQSSIRSLRRFPFGMVKISGRAIIEAGVDDPTLLRAMVDLCHTLGLRVIAEGVEDKAVVHQLVAIGCENGQGYFFDRPMPLDDLMARVHVDLDEMSASASR